MNASKDPMMTVPLTELLHCVHPIELRNQCASNASGTPTALQCCSRCGSFRWLRGAHPGAWERPSLIEQAVIQQSSEPIDPRIVAAIKDRESRTDRYGDDLVFQVHGDLTNCSYVERWMPEHEDGCDLFRAMPEDERFRILRVVLDEPIPGRGYPE